MRADPGVRPRDDGAVPPAAAGGSAPRIRGAVRRSRRRGAIGDFVADIPLRADHVSALALAAVRDGLPKLWPASRSLLVWGPRDPVFSERYLRDLLERLPHADVHRYEGASHLVIEDAPQALGAITRGSPTSTARTTPPPRPPLIMEVWRRRPLWAALADRAGDQATAIVELRAGARPVTFGQLEQAVRDLAAGLAAQGVRPGDRVALLVPPGAELAAALYACWRIGAVVVVADAGLGLRGLGRALRGAAPDHVIGIGRGLAAAGACGSRAVGSRPAAALTPRPPALGADRHARPAWPGSAGSAASSRRRVPTPSAR